MTTDTAAPAWRIKPSVPVAFGVVVAYVIAFIGLRTIRLERLHGRPPSFTRVAAIVIIVVTREATALCV